LTKNVVGICFLLYLDCFCHQNSYIYTYKCKLYKHPLQHNTNLKFLYQKKREELINYMGNGVKPPCYTLDMIHPNRIWQSDNVLKNEFPILALQVGYVVLLSRLFFFIYRPLCLPRLISQLSVSILIT
jgi:hypothetical protein